MLQSLLRLLLFPVMMMMMMMILIAMVMRPSHTIHHPILIHFQASLTLILSGTASAAVLL